jgi:hypothetical protein
MTTQPTQIGRIESSPDGAVMFSGKPATTLYSLLALSHALRIEIRCPGMKAVRGGALRIAKQRTGLKTNDRRTQLARVEVMIEAARAQCVTVVAGEGA